MRTAINLFDYFYSLRALGQLEREPWVADVQRSQDGAQLRLQDYWKETVGQALEEGDGGKAQLADLTWRSATRWRSRSRRPAGRSSAEA